MKRSGFARPQIERKPVVYKPIAEKHRRTVSYGMSEMVAVPKRPPARSQSFRDLARGKACMLRIPGVCCGDVQTTVLAHSNQSEHGKGMGQKASDWYGVWACHTCHGFLDQGKGTRAEKNALFATGLERMAVSLRQMSEDPSARKKDRETADWALEGLAQLTEG